MAIAFKASVTGNQKLQAKLQSLKKRTATKACRAGVNAGSKVVLKAAKQNLKRARKRGRKKGRGQLEKSLGRKVYVKKGVAVAITGPREGFVDPVTGSDPRKISHFVEKGRKAVTAGTRSTLGKFNKATKKRGERVVKKTGRRFLRFKNADGTWTFVKSVKPAAAEPFMEPALDRNRSEIMDASAQATWGVIEKDAKA